MFSGPAFGRGLLPAIVRHGGRGAVLAAVILASAWRVACAAPNARSAIDYAEQAVRMMEAGDLRGAALAIRQGQAAEPGSGVLRDMSGALLTLTGSLDDADAAWKAVLADRPADPLATYGLGLVELARGNRTRTLELMDLAGRTGRRDCCMLVSRYAEWLNAPDRVRGSVPLPDSLAVSARGLDGIAAARRGDHATALAALDFAMDGLPGDAFAEPPGLLMTFEPGQPLRSGTGPLPSSFSPVITDPPDAYSGIVLLKPDRVGDDLGYVVFRIDDDRRTIVNSSPYTMAWNTARVPNGVHHIEISVYDSQGVLSTRATRDVRTFNRGGLEQGEGDPRVEQVRSALWQILTPLPSRLALAYAAAECARALGQGAAEERYLFRAAAIEPGFADVRRRLVAVAQARATEPIWRGPADAPVVALTFDDGPKPVFTDQLLAVLAREGVPATFFVIGRHVTAYPDLTRRLMEAGMQIEDHSYTHSNLTILPEREVERELVRTMATVEAACGKIPRYFRPPGGNTNVEVRRIAAQWGLTPCMWTVDGDKFESQGGEALANYMVNHAAPGAILLLHNGRSTTIDALPRIIGGIRRRGLTFVTLDELLRRSAARN